MTARIEAAGSDALECQVCGRPDLTEVEIYSTFRRVTSDCKAWPAGGRLAVCAACGTAQKPATAEWRAECQTIYSDYVVYRQGPGAEQSTFVNGVAESRSRTFLSWVLDRLEMPGKARAIDFGCGDGALLRNLASMAPGWRLSGQDLGTRYRDEILAMPGVEAFHVGPVEALPEGYDLITAVHVVEHLEEPAGWLRALGGKLAPTGAIAIEVPDLALNPFDLLIADHATHFTRQTLSTLLAKAGLSTLARSETVIRKELSTLVRRGASIAEPPDADPTKALALVQDHLRWLSRLRDAAVTAASRGDVAVFGTAIGGTWLDGELDFASALFVDEDPKRHRHLHFGRPIVPPEEVPKDMPVIVPMPPETGAAVIGRLQALGLSTVFA